MTAPHCPTQPETALLCYCHYTLHWLGWNLDGTRQMVRVTTCPYCGMGLEGMRKKA